MNTAHKAFFANKTVIITGGTRGIGSGIAEQYLAAGAKVIACARQQPEAPQGTSNAHLLFFAADVRDPAATQALIDFSIAQTGRLDVLINNAGGSPEVSAAQASAGFVNAIISLNLIAPAVLSQQAYQAIKATSECGSIINIASVSAMRPSPGTAVYGAAKAGLVNLTRSLAQEWAPEVRVNVIIAGLTKTEAALKHYGGESGVAKIEARMPMQRMASPQDIARACLYLSGAEAQYISGTTLEVHGGGEPPAFLSLQND